MSTPLRFSANINTFNACADRYVLSGYGERLTTDQLIAAATRVPALTGVELVGMWHVNDGNVEQIGRQVRDAGFDVTCVTPDIWASGKWGWGSFAANDPQIRRDAIHEVKKSMEWAKQLDCEVVDLWFGQDGYDYPFQADYLAAWDRIDRRHHRVRRARARCQAGDRVQAQGAAHPLLHRHRRQDPAAASTRSTSPTSAR